MQAIADADVRFLRTARHPTASAVPAATTFDHLYDEADSFAEVYSGIVEHLVEAVAAAPDRSVLYAVPGSPLVLENSVRRILDDDRVAVDVLPALSFLDEIWARLQIDPVEESVRLIDGHQFSTQAAGERGPLLVAHVHAPWVLSDIKLAIDAGDEQRAVVLQRLGTDEERIFEVVWSDLDRVVEADHLTSLYLPEVTAPVGQELLRTVELMQRLRAECPWDREQDHLSLRKYLVEETYEVLEALDAVGGRGGNAPVEPQEQDADVDRGYEDLEEELGDLWFQILFHAELATEAGQFSIADVARTLYDKMVRRHPHVFDETEVANAEELVANWDRIKQDEKQRASALDGVPMALPALSLTAKLLQRAAKAGHDVDPVRARQVLDDGDLSDREGLGRLLLAVVTLARDRGLEPEDALREAVMAAAGRFRDGEESAGSPGSDWALG